MNWFLADSLRFDSRLRLDSLTTTLRELRYTLRFTMSYEGSAHIQAVRAYLGQLQTTPTEADLKTVMGLLGQSVDMSPKQLIALTSRRKRVAAKSIVSSAGSGSAAASTASDDHEHEHDDEPTAPTETPDTSPRKRAKAEKPAAEGIKRYDAPKYYDPNAPIKTFCFLCNKWDEVQDVRDSHVFSSAGPGIACTPDRELSDDEQQVVFLARKCKAMIVTKLSAIKNKWTCENVYDLIKQTVTFMVKNNIDHVGSINVVGPDGGFPTTPGTYKFIIKEPKETKTKGKHAALEHFEE